MKTNIFNHFVVCTKYSFLGSAELVLGIAIILLNNTLTFGHLG